MSKILEIALNDLEHILSANYQEGFRDGQVSVNKKLKGNTQMDEVTTWKELIDACLMKNSIFEKIETITLTPEELNEQFDNGVGDIQGKPFTAWTKSYVLFPVTYDGAEWVEAVPRNPCDSATYHVGC